MKTTSVTGLVALLATTSLAAPAVEERDVDTSYPYKGPAVPVGDWVNPSVNGNGKGYPRIVEAPAVKPKTKNPTNNVNVVSLAFVPNGINIHYQTPFGLGEAPSVHWGTSASSLTKTATGATKSYERTPSCSMIKAVTQCSEYFHDVQITDLKSGTTYYYQIPAANGTTESDVLSFTTAREAGDKEPFSVALINDMGYTNAKGTHKQLRKLIDDGTAFTWHGGDISYADDWYSGLLPCEDSWPVCYNGSSTRLPGPAPVPDEYLDSPLPEGEIPTQGGPQGGDMSVIYESNWDLWQQWMSEITMKAPYMVLPGNHEATCSEFDGAKNELSAYLNHNKPNSTLAGETTLNYYSCPPSQRNFTAYQHRFRMPGEETGGVSNFWYSFDYGLAHFISMDGETDYPNSPEKSFKSDVVGKNEAKPKPNETWVTDSGPFGKVDGDLDDVRSYEQYQWMKKDLESVDRCVTPWVFVMSHRPLYSSQVSSYQEHMRAAWEDLFLEYEVDAYIAGHIHWYERMLPLGRNGTIDRASVKDNHTYIVNPGKSITHLTNGAAGNIESHSTLEGAPVLNITQFLDFVNFGMGKMSVESSTKATWEFIHGEDGLVGDHLTLVKPDSVNSCNGQGYPNSAVSAPEPTATNSWATTTEVVTSYTTYCPGPTTITEGSRTYTVTEAATLTITDCPCTITHTVPVSANGTSVHIPAGPSSQPAGNATTIPASTLTGGATQVSIARAAIFIIIIALFM